MEDAIPFEAADTRRPWALVTSRDYGLPRVLGHPLTRGRANNAVSVLVDRVGRSRERARGDRANGRRFRVG